MTFRTWKAVIDEQGIVRFTESIQLPSGRKVLVTILDEFAALSKAGETALLSEPQAYFAEPIPGLAAKMADFQSAE